MKYINFRKVLHHPAEKMPAISGDYEPNSRNLGIYQKCRAVRASFQLKLGGKD